MKPKIEERIVFCQALLKLLSNEYREARESGLSAGLAHDAAMDEAYNALDAIRAENKRALAELKKSNMWIKS